MSHPNPHLPPNKPQEPNQGEWLTIHIHPQAPRKPQEGQTCNGCGVCCLAEPCPVGIWVSQSKHGACRALLWDDTLKLYRCGMLHDPAQFAPKLHRWVPRPWLRAWVRRMISSGSGCDCSMQTETSST